MERIQVLSSNITSIGYNMESAILEVEFTSGDIYQYFNIPEHLYNNLMHAASKGQFLNDFIKDNYRYKKIR